MVSMIFHGNQSRPGKSLGPDPQPFEIPAQCKDVKCCGSLEQQLSPTFLFLIGTMQNRTSAERVDVLNDEHDDLNSLKSRERSQLRSLVCIQEFH